MKTLLRFHGAAGGVTGSCYEIETARTRILVDCGLFQGSKSERDLNYGAFPFDPAKVDAVVLTHAHIDHSGLLPKLAKQGFSGQIHTSLATIDLCSVMLLDSAHIQETEVEQLNRRNARRGRPAVSPIYTQQDAAACMTLFRPAEFDQWIVVAPDIRARLWNAGHLLGAASVELAIDQEGGPPLRLLFSGDIGPGEKLLQMPPEGPEGIDYLVCESTYGDRDRPEMSREQRRSMLGQLVLKAAGQAYRPADHPVIRRREDAKELLVDLYMLT